MQYTRNGKKISAEEFNRVKSGDIMPGMGMFGGMFGGSKTCKSILNRWKNKIEGTVKDGNKYLMRKQHRNKEDIDEHNAVKWQG